MLCNERAKVNNIFILHNYLFGFLSEKNTKKAPDKSARSL
jgi:hypothetical protein